LNENQESNIATLVREMEASIADAMSLSRRWPVNKTGNIVF